MNETLPKRIGLLAGSGDIPVYFARQARDKGIKLVSIAFSDDIDARLAPYAEKNYSIPIGRAGKIYQTLKDENVADLIILGKVEKSLIFKLQLFDFQALKFLARLKNKEDKTVMTGIIQTLENDGFKVLDQRECLKEIFPGAGLLTRNRPSPGEMEDIRFGIPLARKMADLEIGQTLVVKNKTVIAVEAIEGTDRALERGCALARDRAVAIKVSRTEQDFRYDCPGVGPETVRTLVRGRASVLALEAGRIMLIDQAETVRIADEAGLSILCV